MKNKLSAMLICALLLVTCGFALPVRAEDASVEFRGQAEKFVLIPASGDLFTQFKNVMPGDRRDQDIEIKNTSNQKVRVFLRAEPVRAEDKAFLERLTLNVKQDGQTLFKAHPSEQSTLADNVSLGEFQPGTGTKLRLQLQVPISLDNVYQESIGHVNWVFTADEVPLPATTAAVTKPAPTAAPSESIPKTGEDSASALPLALLLLSVGSALAAWIRRKRRASATR